MFDGIADTTIVALIGLLGGFLLGLAARMGRFCTLGAIEDLLYLHSAVRMRMWLIVNCTAMVGSFSLIGLGGLHGGGRDCCFWLHHRSGHIGVLGVVIRSAVDVSVDHRRGGVWAAAVDFGVCVCGLGGLPPAGIFLNRRMSYARRLQ